MTLHSLVVAARLEAAVVLVLLLLRSTGLEPNDGWQTRTKTRTWGPGRHTVDFGTIAAVPLGRVRSPGAKGLAGSGAAGPTVAAGSRTC